MIFILWSRRGLKSHIFLISFNISYVLKRKNISDSSEFRGSTWILTRLLEPLVEPKDIRFNNSSNMYMLGLSTWLSPKTLNYHPAFSFFFFSKHDFRKKKPYIKHINPSYTYPNINTILIKETKTFSYNVVQTLTNSNSVMTFFCHPSFLLFNFILLNMLLRDQTWWFDSIDFILGSRGVRENILCSVDVLFGKIQFHFICFKQLKILRPILKLKLLFKGEVADVCNTHVTMWEGSAHF
jgi:hypothetical protein